MKNEMKDRIIKLRSTGHTYSEIAGAVNLSVNTIKSFCQRNNVEEYTGSACKNCGSPIKKSDTKRKRIFCCDKCRVSWWKKNHKEIKTVYSLTCVACGKPFESNGNKRQKYCSHPCYISARFGKGA